MRLALRLALFLLTACGPTTPTSSDAAIDIDAGLPESDAGASSCTGSGACTTLSEVQCTAIEAGRGGCTRRLTPRCVERGTCTGQPQSACAAAGACRWSGTACVTEACSAQASEAACLNLRCAWATLYAGCEGASFDCRAAADGLSAPNACESLRALGLTCTN